MERSEQDNQVVEQYVKVGPLLLTCCGKGMCQKAITKFVLWCSGSTVGSLEVRAALRVQHSLSDGLPRRLPCTLL